MRWNAEVADAKTGAERIIQIDADSAADAERILRKKGMLVSAVHPSTVKTEAEQLDDMVADATASVTVPPLNYATPYAIANSHRPIPDYKDIVRGTTLMNALGLFVLIIGLCAAAIGATVMLWACMSGGNAEAFFGGLAAILYGGAAVVVAIFLRMNAALAGAIRDIARNSFRM